jgi:gamma-glutamyltranspeptidase/glutathione hydrolase
MSIQQAIDAPRLSVTSALGTVTCEGGANFMQPAFPAASFAALQALGHLMPAAGSCAATVGSVQGVAIDPATGLQTGGADLRREGTVILLPAQR